PPMVPQERWSPSGRVAAGAVAVSAWPLSRRLPRPFAWAVRGSGAVLLVRAATNLPLRRLTGVYAGGRAVDVSRGVSIEASAEEIWPLVSDYSVFARIMPDVREIQRSSDGRSSRWTVNGPAGVPIRFDAAETRREEGREIAWKTTDGRLVSHAGVLRLVPETPGRTRVEVRLAYNPLAGATGHAVARLLGADPGTRLRDGLLRLRRHVEGRARGVHAGGSRAW
ncbi:SRPBCC family protein, partial [Nonomuraea lactucae]|uniref:SRPBCC family protein n=1 Tax=Nonomuraea lactucae TaxID=2249762 RepID=UPI0019625B0A